MAKQLNTNGNGKSNTFYTTPDVFVTAKGDKVTIVGLNQARFESLQRSGKEPPIPYREYETEFGGTQKEFLTENDLQNDEEREKWADYKDKLSKLEEKRALNVLRYVYDDGIIVDESKMEQWKKEEEEIYENELPDNRIDLKVAYINAKIIANADDMAEIMASVMERTGVPAHMLDDVRNSFRHSVRPSTTPEVDGEQGTTEQVAVQ